ncbi:MAG: hypothetical protein IJ125_00315 [Atopobiaceae bacterium]|nr:hypothetical protein [Atopobiaceae bacterium]
MKVNGAGKASIGVSALLALSLALGACGAPANDQTQTDASQSALEQQAEQSASAAQAASGEQSTATQDEQSEPNSEQSSAEESMAEESAAEESSLPSQADTSVQRVGAAGVGFCEVPSDWVALSDGMPAVKYSNADTTQIVTLSLYDMSVVPAAQAETFSVDDAAQNVLVALENEGASNITFGGGDIGGYEARIISGIYPDGLDLVAWVFADENGAIHYLSVESGAGSADELMANLQATFSLAG